MGDVAAVGVARGGRPALAAWPRRRARRCLFGPPDPEKTRDFLEGEVRRLGEESREKWNFDFAAGRPMDCGRFVWTPVTGEDAGKEDAGKEVGKADLQTRITDFMRKRKVPSRPKEDPTPSEDEPPSKSRRRFST